MSQSQLSGNVVQLEEKLGLMSQRTQQLKKQLQQQLQQTQGPEKVLEAARQASGAYGAPMEEALLRQRQTQLSSAGRPAIDNNRKAAVSVWLVCPKIAKCTIQQAGPCSLHDPAETSPNVWPSQLQSFMSCWLLVYELRCRELLSMKPGMDF